MQSKPENASSRITAKEWIWSDRHKQRALKLRDDVEKAFTEHPEATGETYGQHLWFTLKMSARFAFTSAAIMLHGLFPFLCTRTASIQIEQVYRIMKSRIPKKRREEIDREDLVPIRLPVREGDIRVAIIGGGFSGAMVLANLVNHAEGPLIIEWFEPGTLGEGVAYSTKNPIHLLNVRAERMGAFARSPEHFYEWLQTEAGKECITAVCQEREIHGHSFMPRAVYAQYLSSIIAEAEDKATSKGIVINRYKAQVSDAKLHNPQTQQLLLTFQEGKLKKEILVDTAVLALGNLPPRSHGFKKGLIASREGYVDDVWNTDAAHLYPHHVHELSADSEIVIVGTGLTTIDTVMTLKAQGYKGTITAISRSGQLPAVHAEAAAYPAWEWVHSPHYAPRTALELLVRFKREVREAEKQGYHWQSVVDSLRPVTQTIWKQLDIAQKRLFLTRLATFWNVHRHRMAPEIHKEIASLQASGMLKVAAGKIYYIGSDKEGITVAYRKRGTNRVETLRPALVLNCTGPEYDIVASDHALLKKLRDRELITVGLLRAGIEITASGSAKGRAEQSLFPIGTLMIGELLECSAVPELREQASEVARHVLERVKTLHEPGYSSIHEGLSTYPHEGI